MDEATSDRSPTSANPQPRRATLSLWSLLLLTGPVFLLVGSRKAVRDNSYLWHIVTGRLQTDAGTVITQDPFSFTKGGEAWRTQSWLADLAYSWAYDIWGIESSRLFPLVVGSLTALVLMAIILRRLRIGPALALVTVLTFLLAAPYMNPRPAIFSYLVLGLLVLICDRRRLTWAIPLLMWLWATLHGSFFLGFVILATYWVRDRDRRLLVGALASLVTVSLTAHGLGVWEIVTAFVGSREALAKISEWRPPQLLTFPFIPVLAGIGLVVAWAKRGGVTPWQAFMLSGWFLFALNANRSVFLAWVVLLPILTESAQWIEERLPGTARLPRPIVLLVGALALVVPTLLPIDTGLDEERFPLEAADALYAERVYHDDATGGYLILAQWPERLVYIDDRAELYGEEYVRFSQADSALPEWREVFADYDIQQALVRSDEPIAEVLRASEWTIDHSDESFTVFSRP